MKRRDFVRIASCGVAGAALATSCTPGKDDNSLAGGTADTGSPPRVPDYDGFAQTSPGGGTTKSASDTVVMALIGAGGWGTKIALEPGEKKTVRFTLGPDDFSYLDQRCEVVIEPGMFEVMVGRSSEDIRLRGSFEVMD